MRKTGMYGYGNDVNIEWPTVVDLMKMANGNPFKIKDLKYQGAVHARGNCFGAFQVILSNGMSSPVFNSRNTKGQEMQSFNVPDYSLVKRVHGT